MSGPCFLQVWNLDLPLSRRDRWTMWLDTVETGKSWRSKPLTLCKTACWLCCAHLMWTKPNLHLIYALICEPSTMYINEVTFGPCCRSQACWWDHPFSKDWRAGQAHCQWHHTVSYHFMKSKVLDCFFSVRVACAASDGVADISCQQTWYSVFRSQYHKRCTQGTVSERCPGAGTRIRLGCGTPLAVQCRQHQQWCTLAVSECFCISFVLSLFV